MRMIVYDGTPEEIARLLDLEQRRDVSAPPPNESPRNFVSASVAARVLTRRPLSEEQQAMLRMLYNAGERWTSAMRLQDQIGYAPNQFAGLMGAFGRRITQTEGYLGHTSFFDQEWDHENGCNRYRLPPSVRAAIESSGVVKS